MPHHRQQLPLMKKNPTGKLMIGTSNIVAPGKRADYPEAYRNKSRLQYYSSIFNSLEINSTFYKVPMPSTFERWSEEVPEDFQFTIKLWKEITHCKNLNYDAEKVAFFMNAASRVGAKTGCLLIQFPGKISIEYFSEVEQLLEQVDAANQLGWRIAVEFRNADWYVSETFELLDEYNASAVLHDIPKARNNDLNKKAGFVYCRFHGPTGNYRDSYSDEFLQEKATQIKAWLQSGRDVYAYFNNTMGSALENVLTLQRLCMH